MFEDHLVKRGVIAPGDELLGLFFVEGAGLFHKTKEGAAAVVQVGHPVLDLGRAERVNVEADVLAVFAVIVAFESANLIEGNAKIAAAERLVLIEL